MCSISVLDSTVFEMSQLEYSTKIGRMCCNCEFSWAISSWSSFGFPKKAMKIAIIINGIEYESAALFVN